ncbi:isopeptide-forming domain-containing fimbrial protein, partial [Bifidobacterium longum]
DLPGVNGEYLWSMVKNDAMAFFSQDSNRTASPYVIKYSTQTPYIATKNADGTYTLMLTLDRYRDGITAIGQPNRPVWTVDSKKVTISIPQRKTTEADYHYNTAKVSKPSMPNEITASYHYNVVNYTPNVDKHFTDGTNIADHQVFSDGSVATASIKTTLPVAADIQGGLKNFTITENYSNYAQYVGTATFKVTDDNGNDVTDQWNINDNKQGLATISLKDPSTANGQTVTIVPTWTINKDVPNGSTFKNVATVTVNDVPGTPSETTIQTFTQNPTKDVELGDDVQGDTPSSINGQVIASGSEVTYPLSDKNGLPANRAQDITSHVVTDALDSGLEYVGYKAYLPDANGTLQDITNHVLLTKDGQNLTFTDDNYLLGLYNKDKGTEFKTPIIDLVAKATAATKT